MKTLGLRLYRRVCSRAVFFLLLETGDALLLETGDKILLY
jgi:hypothetical protein